MPILNKTENCRKKWKDHLGRLDTDFILKAHSIIMQGENREGKATWIKNGTGL